MVTRAVTGRTTFAAACASEARNLRPCGASIPSPYSRADPALGGCELRACRANSPTFDRHEGPRGAAQRGRTTSMLGGAATR
eukprot:6775533-Prymnesium_polylepis.1